MVSCAATNCNVKSGQGVTMFRFPSIEKEPERRFQWIANLQTVRPGFEPLPYARLCMRHFANDQFAVSPSICQSIGFNKKKHRLKDDAVPTLFDNLDPIPLPSSIRKTKTRKRKKMDESSDSESYTSTDTEPYDVADYDVDMGQDEPEPQTSPQPQTSPTPAKLKAKVDKNDKTNKRVICGLAKLYNTQVPTFVERRLLACNGLGDKVVEFPENGTPKDVTEAIHRAFPKLGGRHFDIMKTDETSNNPRYLIRIGRSRNPCKVEDLLNVTNGEIYIRPTTDIMLEKTLSFDAGDEVNTDVQTSHEFGTCHLCGKSVALDTIDDHVKQCKVHSESKLPSVNTEGVNDPKPVLLQSVNTSKDSSQSTPSTSQSGLNTQVPRMAVPDKLRKWPPNLLLSFKDQHFIDSFRYKLFELQQSEQICDLIILCSNNISIKAHKVVFLACGSPFLTSILKDADKRDIKPTVVHLRYSHNSVLTLVRYVYTGEIVIRTNDACEFLEMCTILKLDRVRDIMKPLLGIQDHGNVPSVTATTSNQTKALTSVKINHPVEINVSKVYTPAIVTTPEKVTVPDPPAFIPNTKPSHLVVNPQSTSTSTEKESSAENFKKLELSWETPRKLSDKLRFIMQKNEKLFNDVGLKAEVNTKVNFNRNSYSNIVSKYTQETERIENENAKIQKWLIAAKAERLENENAKIQKLLKTSSLLKNSSAESTDSKTSNLEISEGDIIIKRETDASIVDVFGLKDHSSDFNEGQEKTNDDKFVSSSSSDKLISSTSCTQDGSKRIMVENEFVECTPSPSYGLNSEFDPNIVIKSEPPCDYEAWQSKHYLGVDLENGGSLGNVNIKEEPS